MPELSRFFGIVIGCISMIARRPTFTRNTATTRPSSRSIRSLCSEANCLAATPLPNYHLRLALTDGRVMERDLQPLLVGPIFEPIRKSEERFKEMRVEGGTIVWPGGADLCPDVLIWGGFPPADAESDAA